jgi:hypothetical protein
MQVNAVHPLTNLSLSPARLPRSPTAAARIVVLSSKVTANAIRQVRRLTNKPVEQLHTGTSLLGM